MRQPSKRLLGRRVLGDGLGALRHGVLGQFTREEKTDSRLDLPRGDGGALVVVSQTRGLRGNALEDVVHEAVHDRHGLAGDPGVGVNLLEHLVDVDSVGLLPPLLLLLVTLGDVLLGLAGLLRSLASCLGSHGETMQNDARVVVTNDYIPAYSFFTRPAGLFVSSVFVAGGIGEIFPWSRVQARIIRSRFAVCLHVIFRIPQSICLVVAREARSRGRRRAAPTVLDFNSPSGVSTVSFARGTTLSASALVPPFTSRL